MTMGLEVDMLFVLYLSGQQGRRIVREEVEGYDDVSSVSPKFITGRSTCIYLGTDIYLLLPASVCLAPFSNSTEVCSYSAYIGPQMGGLQGTVAGTSDTTGLWRVGMSFPLLRTL